MRHRAYGGEEDVVMSRNQKRSKEACTVNVCVLLLPNTMYGNRDSAKVTEATIWRLLAKVCQAESGRRRRWNTQNPLNHPSQPHPGARSDGIPCPICPTHKQNCVQTPGMPDMYSFFQSNHCHQHLVYHDAPSYQRSILWHLALVCKAAVAKAAEQRIGSSHSHHSTVWGVRWATWLGWVD